VSVTVASATATPPIGVIFTASADNATVTSYRLDVFVAGADPNTATPIASMDGGTPAPDSNNNITILAPSFFCALAAGNYQLTVTAVSSLGEVPPSRDHPWRRGDQDGLPQVALWQAMTR